MPRYTCSCLTLLLSQSFIAYFKGGFKYFAALLQFLKGIFPRVVLVYGLAFQCHDLLF